MEPTSISTGPPPTWQKRNSTSPTGRAFENITYEPQLLFEKVDTAKPKNQKTSRPAGQFLADNEFGVAVVVLSTSMTGDTQKDWELTQARASVVRDHLVDNFGFDDAQLKTYGVGRENETNLEGGWGAVEIVIYPPGTDVPTN